MVGPLVLVLACLSFALLMIAERVGLSASLGLVGLQGVLALAVVALGFASVTSRFGRFSEDQRAGASGPGLTTLIARCCCLLVLLFAFAPAGLDARALAAGFAAGFFLAHIGARLGRGHGLAARLSRLLLALALVLLVFVLLRPLREALSNTLTPGGNSVTLVVGALALAVLLPGGARGAGRLQRLMLALALVSALVPSVMLGLASATGRGDPLALEMLAALMPLGQGPLGRAALGPFHPALVALVMGALGGICARGTGTMPHGQALGGVLIGLFVTLVLVVLQLGSEDWLARIVGQRIMGLAPAAWPPFVFEPDIAGWLRTCGLPPADPIAAARACALAGPQRIPKPGDITFLATLSLPALAVANRLPVLLGEFWALLPVALGTSGLLSLLHGAALAFSESVIFGLINPTGLPSFRLAMARLSLLALVLAFFATDMSSKLPLAPLMSAFAILLGLSALLFALSNLRRSSDKEDAA